MIAVVHAKVTDFGMSKLASVNHHITHLTLCPGNLYTVSPEALEEPSSYTEKLDIVSFGVLQIQMTGQFPNPGPCFQVIEVPDDPRFPEGNIRILVPETHRRSAHLQLISSAHPLKAIALNCLKDKERECLSTQQLSNALSELKGAPQYAQSMQQAPSCVESWQEVYSQTCRQVLFEKSLFHTNLLELVGISTFPTYLSIWNLDFFRMVYSPFCLHSCASGLQVLSLDYITAVYPLVLIILTYTLVTLHYYDCKLVVWMWRPFHRCVACFQRKWDIQNSLVDAFATFLLLSYVKFLSVSVDILMPTILWDKWGQQKSIML